MLATNFDENEQVKPLGYQPAVYTEWFGPCAWKLLHSVSFTYLDNPTPRDKENYKNFYNSLQYVLPCAGCRENWAKKLKTTPMTDEVLKNRATLSKWVYDRHREVNIATGKGEGPSYSEVVDIYTNDQKSLEKTKLMTTHAARVMLGDPKVVEAAEGIPKGSKQTFFNIFLLILVVILIILVFYFAFKNK